MATIQRIINKKGMVPSKEEIKKNGLVLMDKIYTSLWAGSLL